MRSCCARRLGARPSVDTRHPDLPLTLFVGPENATLYADTSGEALFKRGWRDVRDGDTKGEAPLKETLAAAMLAAAGWQGRAEDGPLFDPCCGAGTIVIEAAQMACGIAPGATSAASLSNACCRFKAAACRPGARFATGKRRSPCARTEAVPLFAGDVSFRMTDFATRNAERAGVAAGHRLQDRRRLAAPAASAETGTLMMNPPYGERIEAKGTGSAQHEALDAREAFEGGGTSDRILQRPGRALEAPVQPAGTAWLLSPDMQAARR